METRPSAATSLIYVSTPTLRAGVDASTGALASLETADGSWRVSGRTELATPFRLLVPLPDRRYNYVDGCAQELSRCDIADDGSAVTLEWDSVRSEHGGSHDIAVKATVSVADDRLVFTIEIDNRSDLTVENVHYPCLGDLRPPNRDREFGIFGRTYASARRLPLWPQFENAFGYYGFDHPTAANTDAIATPASPYLLLEDGQCGLYIGVDVPSPELVTWIAELHPGWGDSITSRMPDGGRVSGHNVATRFDTVHVPYVAPGERRALTPIAMQSYRGDWHAGVDIYAQRRSGWVSEGRMTEPCPPAWICEPHSWQQIQLNSSEDHLRIPFRELPAIAKECAERGVTAIQVVGWNHGGQDRNNPSHNPDPRLGGADELRAAIEECQRLGVKVVLFTKFVWADRATQWFRDDLVRLAVKDPYGDYYVHGGYRYHTVTQLLDINTRRLIPMCFGSDEWLAVCEREFAKVVDLGADGMLYDESQHHAPALLCFDTSHGHRYGYPVYTRDREFISRLRRGAGSSAPDFLYAGEACYDWELEEYHLAYHRSDDPEHIPLTRFLHPHVPVMTAVTGFDDRNLVNQCLLYRYVMSYEPFHFKGRLSDVEDTVAYGSQMDALRTELRDWFWDGTFRDTVGASVHRDDGTAHHPYAVFDSATGNPPAVAVANYDPERAATVTIAAYAGAPYRYRLVDDPNWHDPATGVTLPPRSAAVLIPEGTP